MYCDVFIMVLTVPLIRLCNGLWTQSTFRASSPMDRGCVMTVGKGLWTATGSLARANATDFNPIISIELAKPLLIICKIDLTACSSPDSLPESGDGCFCQLTAITYDILIRQTVIKEHSKRALVGVYKCLDSRKCNDTYWYHEERYELGWIPIVVEPVTSKYSIVGCQEKDVCNGKFKEFETQSATVSLLEGQDIQVKMCVHNLINGSVSVESSDIKFTDCGDYKLNTGAVGETTLVTWSYAEDACPVITWSVVQDAERTGKYELRILAVNTFRKKSSGSKACPNIGVTLAALFAITTAVSKGWTINAIF